MKHGNQSVSTSDCETQAQVGGFELVITQLIGGKGTVIIEAWSFPNMEGLAAWKLSTLWYL